MKRHLIRCGVITLMLLGFLLPAEHFASADNKRSVIASGNWTGNFERVMVTTAKLEGTDFSSDVLITGDLDLNIDGDNVTGSIKNYHVDFSYEITGMVNDSDSCTLDVPEGIQIPSGTVSVGTGGLPLLTMNYIAQAGPALCGEYVDASANDLILQAEYATETHLAGNEMIFTDPNIQMALGQLAKGGAIVTITDHWELNTIGGPMLSEISPQYVRYFLQEIPQQNQYSTTVDWNNQPPGKVTFSLNGVTKDGQMSGNVASQVFEIGNLPVGKNLLTAVAIAANNNMSPTMSHVVILVTQPGWAKKAGFAGHPETDHIIYVGKQKYPEKPLDASITLPDFIPFIGGPWGLLPTQLNLNISATSAGGMKNDKITGQGGVGLGGKQFNLDVSGATYTDMSETELRFLTSTAYLKLDPVTFSKQVGLITIIPGADSLFTIPVLGDLLKGVNGIASVTGNITTSLYGEGDIEAKSDQSALEFVNGKMTTEVEISVMSSVDVGLAWALVEGGGNGWVKYQLVPEMKPIDCMVKLFFKAAAGLASFFHVNPAVYSHDWTIAQCTPTTYEGGNMLASYRPLSFTVQPQLEQMTETKTWAAGIEETILVEDASRHAKPALALDPNNGNMAFTWMSVDPSQTQTSQIKLRYYDGEEWGEPVNVSQGVQPAFTPTVAMDGQGSVLLVWAENKSTSVPTALDEDFARAMEIHYAVYDPQVGKISIKGALTDDDVLDFSPQIARGTDGSLWLAWQSSPFASLAGTGGAPNQIKTARWNGKEWSDVQLAATNLVGTIWWNLAAGDNRALLIYDVDTDGDLLTAQDREIFIVKGGKNWGKPQQLTKNNVLDTAPKAVYTPEGEPVLVWLRGNEVVGLIDKLSGEAKTLFNTEIGPGNQLGEGVLIAGVGGELGLVIPGASNSGPDVWLVKYDPAAKFWDDQKEPLLKNGNLELSISAGLAQNGDLLIAAASVPIESQEVTLTDGNTGKIPVVGETANLEYAKISAAFQSQDLEADTKQNDSLWWALGGAGIFVCGLIVVVAIVIILVLLRRRKK